jgi:hypothetical protein
MAATAARQQRSVSAAVLNVGTTIESSVTRTRYPAPAACDHRRLFANRSRAESAIIAVAVLGQVLLLLGYARALLVPVLFVLYTATLLFCLRRARWKILALVVSAATPLLVLACYPPIAFDETLYHLPYIEAFAAARGIVSLPLVRFPIFPYLHELLCVGPFLAFGELGPHFVAVVELLLLAGLVAAWSRTREAAFLAIALCVGHPIVVQFSTVTYVELALALFVAAGFHAADRDEPALAGFLFATACSVKYLGWYFAGFGALYLLFFSARRRRALARFAAAFLAGLAPMYGRLIAETGNPFFPYFSHVFGASPWAAGGASRPADEGANALRLLWDITFARERVNAQPPYSPLFALAIGVIVIAAFRNRRAAFLTVLVAGYLFAFSFLPQDSRYLLPLVPLVSVGAAEAIAPRLGRRWTLALALLAISPAFAYAGYRIARQGLPPASAAARRRYLEEQIPEYRALLHRDPGRTFVAGAEQLHYYGHGEVVGDVFGPFDQERIVGSSRTSAELANRLRALGVRELLLSRRACPEAWQQLPAAPEFELVYADTGAALWRLSPRAPMNSR